MGVLSSIAAVMGRSRVERVYLSDGARLVEGLSVEELYATQPHLRAVVDFLARNVAQLPLKCFVRESDTDRRRDTGSALASLLACPNPQQTRYDLIAATVAELCLYDRFVWFVGRDSRSASGYQVRLIPHGWVQGWSGSDGWSYERLAFCNPEVPGAPVEVPTSSCVICHGYRPGSPTSGSSPVEALRHTLAEQVHAQAFRTQAWRRGARITGYISRPKDAARWGDAALERFVEQMRANWTGDGPGSGGTPVLEDGMEYRPVEVSTREKDWLAGVQLAREDVAAAYHVNPSVIWPGDGQTYASARDNARALYADTLGPLLTMLSERINKDLLPMVGADPREYVEFDIQAKLQGSFEEQAGAMQSSVGGPWVTRNEARARMNLPAVDGGDELIVPLNVVEGGLASPADTDPTRERYSAAEPAGTACACGCGAPRKSGDGPRHKAAPTEEEGGSYEGALRAFFARQRRAVLPRMGASKARGEKADGDPAWWDSVRWDEELAADLMGVIEGASEAEARRTLADLGIDPDLYSPERAHAFLLAVAARRAAAINAATLRDVQEAVADADAEPADAFDRAEGSRASQLAATLATTVAAWSATEAARQRAPRATKTWVTGPNPRPSHARMDGQTVPMDRRFSNGAEWPGDSDALDAADVSNCNCTVEIRIP